MVLYHCWEEILKICALEWLIKCAGCWLVLIILTPFFLWEWYQLNPYIIISLLYYNLVQMNTLALVIIIASWSSIMESVVTSETTDSLSNPSKLPLRTSMESSVMSPVSWDVNVSSWKCSRSGYKSPSSTSSSSTTGNYNGELIVTNKATCQNNISRGLKLLRQ